MRSRMTLLLLVVGAVSLAGALGSVAAPASAVCEHRARACDTAGRDAGDGDAPSAPVITSGPPPSGTVGVAYSPFTVTASGVPAPRIRIMAGIIPFGLDFDPLTGQLTGTPTTDGTFRLRVEASNSVGSVSRFYAVVIAPPAPPTPPSGDGSAQAAQLGRGDVGVPG